MKRAIGYLFFLLIIGCQTTPHRSLAKTGMDIFEFHSSIWMNLHLYLYKEAFRSPANLDLIPSLSRENKKKLNDALKFYQVTFEKRDLLFDDGLRDIGNELSQRENADNLDGVKIPDNLKSILGSVYPIYKQNLWLEHDNANQKWISNAKQLLDLYGFEVQHRLEKILLKKFSDTPDRVDICHDSAWSGGYTSRPAHTVISSSRENMSGYASLEMLFHEAMHAGPFDNVSDVLDKEFALNSAQDKDQVWHALIFFTAGETVQEVLKEKGIDYTPFAYKNGLFSPQKSWGKVEVLIRKYWLPYIQGQTDMEPALHGLVKNAVTEPSKTQ